MNFFSCILHHSIKSLQMETKQDETFATQPNFEKNW